MVVFNKWTGGVEGIHSDEMIETQEQHTQGKRKVSTKSRDSNSRG
jgi:hypothetical protein